MTSTQVWWEHHNGQCGQDRKREEEHGRKWKVRAHRGGARTWSVTDLHSKNKQKVEGGAWWAAIYGVTQSRTRLKWLSSSSSSGRFERGVTLFGLCVVMISLAVVLRTDCRGEGQKQGNQWRSYCNNPRKRGGTSIYYISSLRLEGPWKANTTKLFVYLCSSPLCLVMVGTEYIFVDF